MIYIVVLLFSNIIDLLIIIHIAVSVVYHIGANEDLGTNKSISSKSNLCPISSKWFTLLIFRKAHEVWI